MVIFLFLKNYHIEHIWGLMFYFLSKRNKFFITVNKTIINYCQRGSLLIIPQRLIQIYKTFKIDINNLVKNISLLKMMSKILSKCSFTRALFTGNKNYV